MILPQNGEYVYRQTGNYNSPTTLTQEPGVKVLELIAPKGKEIWIKSLSLNPTSTASVYGQCKITVENGDMGPVFVPLTIQNDYFDYDLVITEGKSLTVMLWTTTNTQSVGMNVEVLGMQYPIGTYSRMAKKKWG